MKPSMESVLVKIQDFTINSSDGVYDGACFYLHLWWSDFSKASGPYYKWQGWCMWHSLFSSPYCGSLLWVRLQVFSISSSDKFCDGAFFCLHAVLVCF